MDADRQTCTPFIIYDIPVINGIIIIILLLLFEISWAGIAQSVQRLATGWTVRGSNPGGERFSAPVQTDPGAHPPSYTMGTESFPGGKAARA
jgi:hypothetical protein